MCLGPAFGEDVVGDVWVGRSWGRETAVAVGQGGSWPEGSLAGGRRLVAEVEDMLAGDGGWEVVAEGDGGDGVRVKEMAQEVDGIYPVVSAVAGAEFGVTRHIFARRRVFITHTFIKYVWGGGKKLNY